MGDPSPRPLRILHLIPTLEGGGAERQLVLLANAQAAHGHEVHVGLLRLGQHAVRLDMDRIRLHRAPALGHYNPRVAAWTFGLLHRLRPDVVHTWLPMMDVLGGVAARALGIPWVVSERASALAYEERWQDRVLRRLLGRQADAVVANSEAGLQYWNAGTARHRLRRVIRNALDLDAIRATPAGDWPGDPQRGARFLFAGRLASQKNVLTFLRALARLRQRHPFSAVILGDGPDAAAARALVAELGLEGTVYFGGYREDVWALMKAATLFVSPSRFEGHPNTVLEAMACGTPVIVSDIPEHREFLDRSTAMLVPPNDAVRLAEALEQALAEPEQARARAAAALPRIDALKAQDAMIAYDEVYEAVRRSR
jgi:glycosyltransferase involved in cell wall biosynthesis